MPLSGWHAELAWLGPEQGVAGRVLVEADGDRIVASPPASTRRRGRRGCPG